MAEPRNTGGGLVGFDETTFGGNTNSGNSNSNPTPPKSNGPPFPIPPLKPETSATPTPKPTGLSEATSVSVPIESNPKKPASKNIRERISVEDEVVKQVVGNFEEVDKIRLFGEYPQNFVDIPKYDLSKLIVVADPDVDFNFIACLKDGEESLPQLFVTNEFYTTLTNNYNTGNPFGVNDIIDEKNIVVIDVKPLKEKIEVMRKAELSINLNRNEINGQVEVKRHLFSYSNYDVGADKVLVANPTYDFIELLKYISWVVTKPAPNYDDRLIPATDLGDFQSFPPEPTDEDEPSNKVDDTVDDNNNPADPNPNLYPPIGRKGVEPGETVLFDGIYFEWDVENQKWIVDRGNSDGDTTGGGSTGGGNTGGGSGGGGPRDRS